jgi:hypothetical protein
VLDAPLYILDLIEQLVRSGASVISIMVKEDPRRDTIKISVDDHGHTIQSISDAAPGTFSGTRSREPLGVDLDKLMMALEQYRGRIAVEKSAKCRLVVAVTLSPDQFDGDIHGDLAVIISSIVCTNPELDLRLKFRIGEKESFMNVAEEVREFPAGSSFGLSVARQVHTKIMNKLEGLREYYKVSSK